MSRAPFSDAHGRSFHYLRLSVTDVCNFRCVYCLPNGFKKDPEFSEESPLAVSEIKNLVSGFARLGFWKVRLTGGEPTVRKDIVEIAETVSRVAGIRKLALTTNGYRLKSLAKPLFLAGVRNLNVSVDSLDPAQFSEITGMAFSRFQDVMDGLHSATQIGFDKVKINVVLMKNLSDDLGSFTEWIRDHPYSVRFIELMRTRDNASLFEKHHISGSELQSELLKRGWRRREKQEGDGPAVEFTHPDYVGQIGIIAPYSKDFCKTCNRLRVSSRGGLRLCLFGERDHSLRPFLKSESQLPALVSAIESVMGWKQETHPLHSGGFGKTWNFAGIGG